MTDTQDEAVAGGPQEIGSDAGQETSSDQMLCQCGPEEGKKQEKVGVTCPPEGQSCLAKASPVARNGSCMFTHLVPSYDEKFTHQTELSDISDDEFNSGIIPEKATFRDRCIQLLLFLVFFGWLRAIVLIIMFVIYCVLMTPVLVFAYTKYRSYVTPPFIHLTRFFLRLSYFLLGFYYIKVNGTLDKRARLYVFNHQTVLDGPLLYIFRPFKVIGMIEMKKVPVFGRILVSVDTIFVDRSNNGAGMSHNIANYLKGDANSRPLALAPEGKTTKGKFLLQFRTGAFLEPVPVQPVAIRYTEYLPYGKAGIVWAVGGFGEWLWRSLCLPMATIEMTYMPLIDNEEYLAMSPADKAKHLNLIFANQLGVQATNRSNRNLLQKRKAE